MRTPRCASILVAAAAAGFTLAACGGGGGTTPSAGQPVRPAGLQTTAVPAPTPGSDDPSPDRPDYGTGGLTGGCVLGIFDQNRNEFYQLAGLAHGSEITTGDLISEAYQLTLADNPSAPAVTVTGFTIAVFADGKKLATTSEHLPARRLIPPGQVLTFTEFPWGSSKARQGLTVGPFAARGSPPANLSATCRLIRLDSR